MAEGGKGGGNAEMVETFLAALPATAEVKANTFILGEGIQDIQVGKKKNFNKYLDEIHFFSLFLLSVTV